VQIQIELASPQIVGHKLEDRASVAVEVIPCSLKTAPIGVVHSRLLRDFCERAITVVVKKKFFAPVGTLPGSA